MSASARIALVTGAGTGVGKAVAIALARAGYNLVLAGRRKEPLAETATAVNAAGTQALAAPTDVTQRESIIALFDQVK
jgi:NADP-dependent 3-hydroxy acid dehydrogenase YdfG